MVTSGDEWRAVAELLIEQKANRPAVSRDCACMNRRTCWYSSPFPQPKNFPLMRSRRYTIVLADRRTGVVRRFTIGLWPTLATVTGVMALARAHRHRRRVEGQVRRRAALRVAVDAGDRELQLPHRHRSARRPDSGPADRDRRARRQGRARSVAAVGDGQAARGRQEPRDGRRLDRRRADRRPARAAVAGEHVRAAARAARRASRAG